MKGEFYKMDFRAWNIGTVDLSLEQEAAYLRLCHAMYDAGGSIPNSTRLLQSIFRCGNAKAAALVRQLVKAGKIQVDIDEKLSNRRVLEELSNREKLSEERRAAGRKGGSAGRGNADRKSSEGRVNPEWSSSEPRLGAKCSSNEGRVNQSNSLKNNKPAQANASTSGSREDKRREESPKAPKGAKGAYSPEFERWLETYPNRHGVFSKPIAARRYDAARKAGATQADLEHAKRAYAAEQDRLGKIGTQFVKRPEFFLSADFWPGYLAQAEPSLRDPNAPDPYLCGLSDDQWRQHLRHWQGGRSGWALGGRTPPPDHPETKVPSHILNEFGLGMNRRVADLLTGTG